MAGRQVGSWCRKEGSQRYTLIPLSTLCVMWCVTAASLHAAQDPVTPPTSLAAALPAEPTWRADLPPGVRHVPRR